MPPAHPGTATRMRARDRAIAALSVKPRATVAETHPMNAPS